MPTTGPACRIAPAAQALLDASADAYRRLRGLTVAGTVQFDFDADVGAKHEQLSFDGSFAAPNLVRHAVKDGEVIGSTGKQAYAYLPQYSAFIQQPASSTRPAGDASSAVCWPADSARVLHDQDPALLMAADADPASVLTAGYSTAEVALPATDPVSQAACDAIMLAGPGGTSTVLLDRQTHLLRRVSLDQRLLFELRGVPNVKQARTMIQYTAVSPDAPAAADRAQYAWSPPAEAHEIAAADSEAGGADAVANPASALLDKPAPDFTLSALDGSTVKLAEAKGSVVVLDFWATWCGPCMAALPKLDALAGELKPTGTHVFAINLSEPRDTVKQTIDAAKWTLPILLDAGATAEAYHIDPIPTTIVIDRAGIVRAVLTAAPPSAVRAAIESAGRR